MKRIVDLGIVTVFAYIVYTGGTMMNGCATVKEFGQNTIDCSQKAMVEQVGTIFGRLSDNIMKDNWRAAILDIATEAGAAVVKCAMDALYAQVQKEISKQSACGWQASCLAGGDPMAEFKRARIVAWYKANGYIQ